MNVSAPLAKMLLVLLASMASATAINGTIQRKMRGIEKIMASGSGVVRTGKRITLSILNGVMDDIIRFIKLLESSVVLLDGVIETVIHEIKIHETELLGMC